MEPKTVSGRPCVIWFTGLSGAGKSTLTTSLASHLAGCGLKVTLLDGDAIRQTLNQDLGFSDEDRRENVRRLGELALRQMESGNIVLVAAISPHRDSRARVRARIPAGGFIEVFVDAPLKICEARDPKGLYRKARRGIIQQFTGISADYQPPVNPEIHLRTSELSPGDCLQTILTCLIKREVLEPIDKPDTDGPVSPGAEPATGRAKQ